MMWSPAIRFFLAALAGVLWLNGLYAQLPDGRMATIYLGLSALMVGVVML